MKWIWLDDDLRINLEQVKIIRILHVHVPGNPFEIHFDTGENTIRKPMESMEAAVEFVNTIIK